MPVKTVLIADDDSLVAELIQNRLERDGHKTVVVNDGSTACTEVRTLKPDAVILDGVLPDMDGLDVLRTLKANEETRDIPVLMLTARGKQEDLADGMTLGADDYLVKPFVPNELSERLSQLLS